MLFIVGVGDVCVVAAAWLAGYGLRYLGGKFGWMAYDMPPVLDLLQPALVSMFLAPFVFIWSGLYAPRRTSALSSELAAIVKAVIAIWVVVYFLTILLTHQIVSRLAMVGMLAAWLILESVFRMSARLVLRQIRKRGRNLRYAAIVGSGRMAQHLYHALEHNTWTGIKVAYFVDDRENRDRLCGLRVYHPIDQIDQIADILAIMPVDIVFVALPKDQQHRADDIISCASQTNAAVGVIPDLLGNILLRQKTYELDDVCVVSLTASPQHEWRSLVKRTIDVAVSLALLTILAFPMLLVAALIKCTSRGPVFYRQIRASLASRPFRMIKFRTMVQDAEQHTGPVFAAQDDPRTTRVGRFLRRLSLDELPQLFNVLAGHMSLVGPRPERPEIVDRLRRQIPRYMLRTQVRPGMTGLAQVGGYRGRTSLRKRTQYDLHYIRNWSLWLDLGIMLRTLLGGFRNPDTAPPVARPQPREAADEPAHSST